VIRRASALAALCLGAAVSPAAAQLPNIFPPGSDWRDLVYPKIFWTAREGVTAGAYFAVSLPTRYADRTAAPHRLIASLDGQIAASGTRHLKLDAWAPALAPGWRFRLTLAATHRNRQPYFGIGNTTTDDQDEATGEDLFYHMVHVRNYVRGDVQRTIVGPLRALVGWHAEHWYLDTLRATSQLATDLATAADPRIAVGTADVSLRVGLVVDTRDREAAPQNGVLLEALHAVADEDVAGDLTYTRTTLSLRGYRTFADRWGVAARIAGESMGGTPRLGSLFRFEASDAPFTGLGGADSHRALYWNRFADADKLLGNLEVRYALIPYGLRTVLVAFLDVGRVFPAGDFRLTTDDLKVGGGGGLFVTFLSETAILGLTAAAGPEGPVIFAHWKWPF